MNDPDLLHEMGVDVSKWAASFCERFPDNDEGTMLGWFANAIEAGRAAGYADGRADMHLERTGWPIADTEVNSTVSADSAATI